MSDMILVKVAPIGSPVTEVLIPAGSSVSSALTAAKISIRGSEDIRRGGLSVSPNDVLKNGDIITLVPPIRGGI